MFIGHYAAALIAHRVAPKTPLWLLVLSVQLVDVLWAALVLLGIEKAQLDPALPSNPLVLGFMPYSHSLISNLAWAMLGYAFMRLFKPEYGLRASMAVAICIFSHWALDLLVHRPDLPLWSDTHKLGLGLWNHPLAAFTVETGMIALAAWYWLRKQSPGSRARLLIGALLALHLLNAFGPAPTDIRTMTISGLLIYLGLPVLAYLLFRQSTSGASIADSEARQEQTTMR